MAWIKPKVPPKSQTVSIGTSLSFEQISGSYNKNKNKSRDLQNALNMASSVNTPVKKIYCNILFKRNRVWKYSAVPIENIEFLEFANLQSCFFFIQKTKNYNH